LLVDGLCGALGEHDGDSSVAELRPPLVTGEPGMVPVGELGETGQVPVRDDLVRPRGLRVGGGGRPDWHCAIVALIRTALQLAQPSCVGEVSRLPAQTWTTQGWANRTETAVVQGSARLASGRRPNSAAAGHPGRSRGR
jgi:hypothetical protein